MWCESRFGGQPRAQPSSGAAGTQGAAALDAGGALHVHRAGPAAAPPATPLGLFRQQSPHRSPFSATHGLIKESETMRGTGLRSSAKLGLPDKAFWKETE